MSPPLAGAVRVAAANPYESEEPAVAYWLETMSGTGGDVLRQSLLNPVLLEVAQKVLRQKEQNDADFCRTPIEVFYSGLLKVRDTLYEDANTIDALRNHFASGPIVDLNRGWCTSSAAQNPDEARLNVLDIGCGEGFAARLLHRYVEKYLGYDASPTLISEAHSKFSKEILSVRSTAYYSQGDSEIEFSSDRANKFSFVRRTWQPQNEQHCQVLADEIDRGLDSIDLVLLLSLLDRLPDPDQFLVGLREIIKRLDGRHVPIVATTLDPAFFAVEAHLAKGGKGFQSTPDAPFQTTINLTNATTNQNVAGKMELRLRAPHDWERVFRRCGYHVLQQVRIHLNVLPPKIGLHFHDLAVAQGCGDPRCAPVVFWVLTPRTEERSPEHVTVNRRSFAVETVKIKKGERLEIVGNLGQHVYFVCNGQLALKTHGYFSTPDGSKGRTRNIPFDQGAVIGELEAIGDPIFSRHIGSVDCLEDAELVAMPIDTFKDFYTHQLSRGVVTGSQNAGCLSKVQSALTDTLYGLARKTAVLVYEYEIDSVHGSGEAKSNPAKQGQSAHTLQYSKTFTSNLCAALFAKRAEKSGEVSFFCSIEIGDLTGLGQMLHNNTGTAPTRAWRDNDVLALCLLQDLGIVDSTPALHPEYRQNLRASRLFNIYDPWAAIGVLLAEDSIFDIEKAAAFCGVDLMHSGGAIKDYVRQRKLLGAFGSLYEGKFGKTNVFLKAQLDRHFGIVASKLTPIL